MSEREIRRLNGKSIDHSSLDLQGKIETSYHYALYHASRYFTNNKLDREDLVQDAILCVLKNPSKIETVTYLKSYIFHVMKGVWRDKLRKASNRYEHSDDTNDEFSRISNKMLNQLVGIEEACDFNTVMDFVRSGKLNPRNSNNDNEGVFLKYLEGYDNEQIGKEFRMSKQRVNASVFSSREKIRNKFK